MAEWKKFTGSEEQINEINDAKHGWIFKDVNGTESLICRGRYVAYRYQGISEYLICEPHIYATMIHRWVDTGQPVYCRDPFGPDGTWRRTSDLAGWYVDLEYSFNPPKEKQFIEVRDYLYKTVRGKYAKATANKDFDDCVYIEMSNQFVKWLDDDWRKVEI